MTHDGRTAEAQGPRPHRRVRDGAYALAVLIVLGVAFAVASGVGHGGLEAGTFALAAVAAVVGLAALFAVRGRDRRDERLARELQELARLQRRILEATAGGKPEPTVLFLVQENEGAQNARIERRRPRPLDITETVAHERAMALQTLPSVESEAPERAVGSLKIYRSPTEHDRNEFRQKVEAYTANLRQALEQYDAYRQERALVVSGRFRFENHGRRPAHNVIVRAYFPDPFEVVSGWSERPEIPGRPTFERKPTGLAALLGGQQRLPVPSDGSIRGRPAVAQLGNVSRPRYRRGSATMEVEVEKLQHSQPADMDEHDRWALRLDTPGEYRIPWEIYSDELDEPARGELRIEVVDLTDDTPIRSVKELLSEYAHDKRLGGMLTSSASWS